MRIAIQESQFPELQKVLKETNGCARKHVWRTPESLVEVIEDLEEAFDAYWLSKSQRAGATATVLSVDPKRFANNYGNRVNMNEGTFKRTKDGWCLIDVRLVSKHVGSSGANRVVRIEISRKQAEASDAAWRRANRISIRPEL